MRMWSNMRDSCRRHKPGALGPGICPAPGQGLITEDEIIELGVLGTVQGREVEDWTLFVDWDGSPDVLWLACLS